MHSNATSACFIHYLLCNLAAVVHTRVALNKQTTSSNHRRLHCVWRPKHPTFAVAIPIAFTWHAQFLNTVSISSSDALACSSARCRRNARESSRASCRDMDTMWRCVPGALRHAQLSLCNVVWGADAQIGLLGKGTFGTVIEAVDTRPAADNDRVAIKFIERGPLVCLHGATHRPATNSLHTDQKLPHLHQAGDPAPQLPAAPAGYLPQGGKHGK